MLLFLSPQLCPPALWGAEQLCATAVGAHGCGELYRFGAKSHEVRYHLPKGVCPSGQQWTVPQAHAGELEPVVIRTEFLGREGLHLPLSGPIKEGQVLIDLMKEKMRTPASQVKQGFTAMQVSKRQCCSHTRVSVSLQMGSR